MIIIITVIIIITIIINIIIVIQVKGSTLSDSYASIFPESRRDEYP